MLWKKEVVLYACSLFVCFFFKFIFKQLHRNEVRLSVPKGKVDDGALTEGRFPVFRPV